MNYTDEVHDLVIKVFSDLSKEHLLVLAVHIEEHILSMSDFEGATTSSYVVKEDAIR